MDPIIKRTMNAFWNVKDWSQKPTSFVLEQFLLETSYPTDGPLCSIFQKTKEIAENRRK